MPSPWLTETEQRAWRRFVAVLEVLPAALDSQLVHDEGLTHFDYFTLAMLSEAPERTLRATALAARTNASLARQSNVLRRLEGRGLLRRERCPSDGRATNVVLTDAGWQAVHQAAPGHAAAVRSAVFDALTPTQVKQLSTISDAILDRLDPDGTTVGRTYG